MPKRPAAALPNRRRTHPMPTFSTMSEQALTLAPPARKGLRTKARLKLAAAKALEQIGYRELRVSDICNGAGLGLATFYLYFANKSEITYEVLMDFLNAISDARPEQECGSVFDAMVATNVHFMQAFAANAGLVRCLLQYGDEAPEFIQLWHSRSHHWYERVAQRTLASEPLRCRDKRTTLLTTYALGGMIDQVVRDLYVHRNLHLETLVGQVAPHMEDLAEFLARIWYRAIYTDEAPITHGDAAA